MKGGTAEFGVNYISTTVLPIGYKNFFWNLFLQNRRTILNKINCLLNELHVKN